jgi:protein AFG1
LLNRTVQTKLFITSEVPIYQVFSDEQVNKNPTGNLSDHMRSVMDDLVGFPSFHYAATFQFNLSSLPQGLDHPMVGTSSVFTGEEEIFAFARACSRLVQMGSKEWANTAGVH